MSAIIVYYSRAGENYVNGEIKNLLIGNTELVAEALSELTGAELFKIEPCVPYSQDYSECINQAKADQCRAARPEIVLHSVDFEQFDTVYLGFPNYWGTMPMPVFTFLEKSNLSGKRICLFCTHEGDGFGHSRHDVQRLCSGSIIEAGPSILGAHISQKQSIIAKWASERNLL